MPKKIHTKDTTTATRTRRAAALDVQAKLKVGAPGSRFEQEADQAAEKVVSGEQAGRQTENKQDNGGTALVNRISRLDNGFGRQGKQKMQRKEEETAQAKEQPQAEDKEDTAQTKVQRQAEEKEGAAQAKEQPQAEDKEDTAQTKVQRQAEEKEETAQAKEQPQAEDKEEDAQTKVQRQAEEEEEAAQAKEQPQAEDKEDAAQTKVQRQTEEEEEAAQAKEQPQAEDKEEDAQTKVQRQAEEEEEAAQAKEQPQAEDKEDAAQTKVQRQAEEKEEAAQAKEQPQTQDKEDAAQTKVQRQAEEKEEAAQGKEQPQAQDKEDAAQTKVQRQAEEEEEAAQAKEQPQAEDKEEDAQTKVQRQAEEEEEAAQAKEQPQAEDKEDTAQTKVQRQAEEEQEAAQAKEQPQAEEKEEATQAKAEPRANVRDKRSYPVLNKIEPKLLASKGRGEKLSDEVRIEMEARFGADFRKVRMHTGANAQSMAGEMNAQAFTNGADIYFNEGKYDPESTEGKRLLAHELTHVVQQGKAEAKIPDAKVAENNAERNNAGPKPSDQEALKAQEIIEKEKKEKAEEELEKPEEVKLSLYEEKDLKAVPELAEGGEGEKRATDKAPPKKGGKGKKGKKKKEEEKKKTPVADFLEKSSDAKVKQKLAGLKKLSKNQQKKEDAGTKLAQTEKSVVPPTEEGQSKANASQVETVDQAEAPKPEEEQAKQELQQAMENAVPDSLEEADKFKEEGKGRVVGEQVRGVVTADTQEVQSTYQEIENTPDPEPDPVPEELPPMEEAPPTAPLNMGEDAVGEVQPEHTDMSEYEQESDQQLEKEGITEEQMEMVDSGPLAEAKDERKGLKDNVEKTPEEVKQVEKEEKTKVQKEMKAEETQGRAHMAKERQNKLKNTQEKQKKTKNTLEEKRKAVTEKINGIYETTNEKVKQKLEDLEKKSLKDFDAGQARGTKAFEDNVKRRLNAFKSRRYSGMFGWARWLKDKLLGMDDLPEVKNIFDTEKNKFIGFIDKLIAKITKDNKRVIQECKDMVQKARDEIAEYVSNLGPELQKTGQQAQADMQSKLDALDEQVNKKEQELKEKLEEKREAAIKAIEEKIEKMKEELKGALAKLAGLLLDALIKFFKWAIEKIGGSSDKLMAIINKGKAVIQAIVKDPGQFLSNLGKAVSTGFGLFRDNFKKHLIGGIVEWLTGAMGGIGIKIPAKFDLKGVMDLGLQVMGLTWDNLKFRLKKYIPEKIITAAEQGLDLILEIKDRGFIVLWEKLKEKADEFKQGVIDSIKNWAVTQLVKGAIIKLATMLNPAGAILQIALTIYDGVMWFIENKDRIIDFINSIFSSIGEIAMGQIGKAAAFVEKALARMIPILLSFLARWLKLSGVAKALKKAIEKVRKPIDKVVDKVLKFIADKAKKLFGKGKAAVKKGKEAVKKGLKKLKAAFLKKFKKTEKIKTKKGTHKFHVKQSGKKFKFQIASNIAEVDNKLDEWQRQSNDFKDPKKGRVKALISSARGELNKLDGGSRKVMSKKELTKAEKAVVDRLTKGKEALAQLLRKLFIEFEEQQAADFKIIYAKELNQSHEKAKLDIEKTVEKIAKENEKAKKGLSEIKSWSGLRKKIENTEEASEIYNNPINNNKKYGEHVKNQIESAGRNALKDNYSDEEKDKVIEQMNSSKTSPAYVAVRDQMFDKSKEADTTQKIEDVYSRETDVNPDLKKALNQQGIIKFLQKLALGQSVEGINAIKLLKLTESTPNRREVADRFRNVQPGNHEWIPASLVSKVLSRAKSQIETGAVNANDLDSAMDSINWINLQNELRSDTSWVVFVQRSETNWVDQDPLTGSSYSIISGHVGALRVKPYDRDEEISATKGTNIFHKKLSDNFSNNEKPKTAIEGAKSIFQSWVWNAQPVPTNIHPKEKWNGQKLKGNESSFVATQSSRFQNLAKHFDNIKAKYGKNG